MRQGWRGNEGVEDSLIADLYESVFSPGDVPAVIARINRYLDTDGVHLVGWDEGRNEVLLSLATGTHIQGAEAAYLGHYQAIDPRRKMGLKSRTGVVVACHDELDDKYVSRSEFYQDFLIPHGPRYVAGGNIYRDGGKNVHIAFNHFVGRPRFEGTKRAALGSLMFHLARWMRMMVRADWLRDAAATGQAAVDAIGDGIVFLDDAGRVLHANPAAASMLGDKLGRVNLGLSGARGGEAIDAHVRAVALTRQPHSMSLTRQGKALAVTISALPRFREQGGAAGLGTLIPSLGNADGMHHRATVILTVRTAEHEKTAVADLSRKWGLTPAEESLLKALAAGASPADHAARRGVKITTVRSQVRAVLEKAGQANLRSLVAFLGGGR